MVQKFVYQWNEGCGRAASSATPYFTILLLCNISNAKIGAGVRQMETSIMSSKDLWGACVPKLKYLQSSELAMHKLWPVLSINPFNW